jgi:hypothetical protein
MILRKLRRKKSRKKDEKSLDAGLHRKWWI